MTSKTCKTKPQTARLSSAVIDKMLMEWCTK